MIYTCQLEGNLVIKEKLEQRSSFGTINISLKCEKHIYAHLLSRPKKAFHSLWQYWKFLYSFWSEESWTTTQFPVRSLNSLIEPDHPILSTFSTQKVNGHSFFNTLHSKIGCDERFNRRECQRNLSIIVLCIYTKINSKNIYLQPGFCDQHKIFLNLLL